MNSSSTGAFRRGCPKVTKARRSRVAVRRSERSFESRTGCVVIGESVACEWESSEEGAECPNYWDRLLRPETRPRDDSGRGRDANDTRTIVMVEGRPLFFCPKTSETKLSTPNHLITMIGGLQRRSKSEIYPTCLEGQELPRNTPKGSRMIPKPMRRLPTKV